MASEPPPPAPSDLPDAEPDERRVDGAQSVRGGERRVDGERFGPVDIARHRKDDGRALILYTHREREQP